MYFVQIHPFDTQVNFLKKWYSLMFIALLIFDYYIKTFIKKITL